MCVFIVGLYILRDDKYWSIGRRSYVGMARMHAQSQKPPNAEGLEL